MAVPFNKRAGVDAGCPILFALERAWPGTTQHERWGDLAKTKQNELFIIKYPMAPRH